ncbi:m-AAA protease-interacting protein 1, mitochondrial [Pseudophryne corroboree]|uniref:m-AAA protease-interacting protein 1, mitochondrial n=1 Tax=Pseudophryne corroboree TaxID=495146 RepID=UPI003081CBA3
MIWRSVARFSRLCTRPRAPICCGHRIPTLVPPAICQAPGHLSVTRGFSSQKTDSDKMVVVGVPNPIVWFRTRIYFFLIQTFFDKDFSIDEFTVGARQAFSFVSGMLSQCKFDSLENLVAGDILKDLQEKCSILSDNYRHALEAQASDIMYSFPGDVAVYYDNSGRKFVSILMRFWYMTCAKVPDEELDGTKVFQVVLGNQEAKDTKRILTANYEFRREFTQGVEPDWIITRIEYSKLLD